MSQNKFSSDFPVIDHYFSTIIWKVGKKAQYHDLKVLIRAALLHYVNAITKFCFCCFKQFLYFCYIVVLWEYEDFHNEYYEPRREEVVFFIKLVRDRYHWKINVNFKSGHNLSVNETKM